MRKIYLNEYATQPTALIGYNEKIVIEEDELKGERLIDIQTGPVNTHGDFEPEDVVVLVQDDLVKVIDALIKAHDDKADIPYARLTDEDRLPNEEKTGL